MGNGNHKSSTSEICEIHRSITLTEFAAIQIVVRRAGSAGSMNPMNMPGCARKLICFDSS